jgi:ribosomal protein S18 acetylase RimI-like enzyme
MMTIRRAVPGDLRTVLAILHSVAGWLHRCGYDQWPDGSPSLGPVRIGTQIERGEFWIVSEDQDPVAVIALSSAGDADFWTSAELTEPAMYVSKAAVLRRVAGRGIGAMLLRWACDRAAAEGIRRMRLDVWKTNYGLQDYYRRQGWHYLGTVERLGRNSGALFWHPAEPDPEAREAFTPVESAPVRGAIPVTAGMQVIVLTDNGPVSAACTQVMADGSYGVTEAGWEQTLAPPPPLYAVERDGASWLAREAWPDPALTAVTAAAEANTTAHR